MAKPVKGCVRGWSARNPEGLLYSMRSTRQEAMDCAAFAHSDLITITTPQDWRRAYRAGWRVVPVILKERKV